MCDEERKISKEGPYVFVLADSVKDTDCNIMNLTVRMVEGIIEPVKLISAAGFAVGQSDTVYTWEVRYQ